jgi:hypothetical protein
MFKKKEQNMKNFFYVGLCSLFFFSCSQAPRAINHEFMYQKNLKAAQHWQLLAKDFAGQTANALQQVPLSANTPGFGHITEEEPNATAGSGSLGKPYIFIQTNDRSSFGNAFRNELITEFTNLGYNISYDSKDAIAVRWGVQKIHHNAGRKAPSVPLAKMAVATLGYGVYKVIDTGCALGGIITGVAFLDVLENFGPSLFPQNVPHDEIILTVSVSKDGLLFARQSGTYYISGEDTRHYHNIADFEGQSEMFLPSKNFAVVNAQ